MGLFSEKKKIYIESVSLYYRDDEPWVSVAWREHGNFTVKYGRRQTVDVKLENFSRENVLEGIAVALAQRQEEDEKEFQKRSEEISPGTYEIDMDEAEELLDETTENEETEMTTEHIETRPKED